MRTRATRRRPLARRAIRGMAGLRRVSRDMRDPWWGPREGWTPIICRRRGRARPSPRGHRIRRT